MAAGIVAIPAVPAYAAAPGTWTANEDDQLFFDLRMEKWQIGNGVRGYQTDRGVCVDFADMIMALELPVRLDKKSRRATGWMFEESRTITVSRDNNTVQIMNKMADMAPGDVYDTPEGWCVNSAVLSSWMNVKLTVDMSNAVLVLHSDRKLPFQLALERKQRASQVRPQRQFDLRSLPHANEPYRMWRTPSVDAVVSFSTVHNAGSGTRVAGQYELYASGEIAKTSVDARLSSDRDGVPNSLRVRAYRTDPDGGLLGPLHATHFGIGDISSPDTPLAARSTPGRGATITNRPVDRPTQFDSTNFRGELPNGWDAELYRNDQLLSFTSSRADGRYEFLDVPLLYGQNRFEIVLYGPQGQERRDVVMVPVGLDSIPPRKTYYWAAFQERGRDLIHINAYDDPQEMGWRSGFGLERGLDAKTAIAASFFSLRHNGRRQSYAETSLRRALGPALAEFSASSDLSGGYAVRAQIIGQLGQSYFTAETIRAYGGYQSEQLDDDVTSLNRFSLDQNVKLGGTMIPVHMEGRYVTRLTGQNSMELGARLSWNIRRLAMTGQVDWIRQKSSDGRSRTDRMDASLRANGQIRRVRIRAEANYQVMPVARFASANVTAQWRAGERSDWRVETGYDAQAHRGRLSGGIVRRFDRMTLSASAEAATDGSVGFGLNLAFSLGQDPRSGSVRMSSTKLASQGQASALVYRDDNGDGIRQPDEPVQAQVGITASMANPAVTGKHGVAMVDGLSPYKPVLIGVDASTLTDPFIQPANSGVVIVPRPGIATMVELPLVSAGEVQGTLVRDGGALLSGVGLELLNANGEVISRTTSEFDGYFLFEKVPYGRYQIRLAALSAAAIGATPLLNATVVVGRDEPSPNLGTIASRPADRIAAGIN